MKFSASNFAGYDMADDEMLDPGTYTFEIVSAECDTAEKSGRDFINIGFRVVEGPDQKSGKPSAGRMMFYKFYLPTDAEMADKEAASLMKAALNGLITTFGAGLPEEFDLTDDETVAQFVGYGGSIKIGHRTSEYNGQSYTNYKLKKFIALE